jgi:subtilase family serine protease
VSKSLAQIVSNSYGDLGEDIAPDVADLGVPSPDFSASSQWVTAVGGTTLGIGADGCKSFETGWETGTSILTDGVWTPPGPGACVYGSGGGTSRLFPEPWHQQGVVPDALARHNQTGSNRGRVVPGISMLADLGTGMLIG